MPAIHLHEISHRFGAALAVDHVSLSIRDGSFAVIMGQSGAGKTTLLRLLAGLESLQQGRISFGSQDVSRRTASKRSVAMVRQDAALYPQLSVLKNVILSLGKQTSKALALEKAHLALEALSIESLSDKLPAQLSGGEAQRVALARALATAPQLLLLDEPLSQIDGLHKDAMIEAIRKAKANTTTVMVSHDPWDTMRLADEVILLDSGKLIQQGSPTEVYRRPASRLASNLLAQTPMNWLPLTELAAHAKSLGGEKWLPAEISTENQWAGFRPESMQLPADATRESILLHLDHLSLQPLGQCQLLSAEWQGHQIRAYVNNTCTAADVHSLAVPADSVAYVKD